MNLVPLKDRLVMQQLAAEEKTASGILLPDSAKEKPQRAKVLAVGAEVAEIKPGDVVYYKSYGPDEVKVDGEEYLIAKEEDILARVAVEKKAEAKKGKK